LCAAGLTGTALELSACLASIPTACPSRSRSAATSIDGGHATPGARGRRLLDSLEIDLCAPVIKQGAQLGVLRVAQVALCLHHEKVR
jgi:hypothetical protein